MGILSGIISYIVGLLVNGLDSLIAGMLASVGFSMTTFVTIFPFASFFNEVFTAMGMLILFVGAIWYVSKGFAAVFGVEYENPLHIFGKVALTAFAVMNLTEILDIVIRFFQITLDFINEQPLNGASEMDQFASSMTSAVLTSIVAGPGGVGLMGLVYVVCIILLAWKFVKLLVELVERYIVFCMIVLVGPSFIATAAFKATKDISGTWVRAFTGHAFLILLNTLSVKLFLSYVQIFTQNVTGVSADGQYIPTISMLFFGFAFLNFASRAEDFVRMCGLNTTHTGASLVDSAFGGINRMMAGARSAGSIYNAAGSAAHAGRNAGGFGTPSGMAAAASSFFRSMAGINQTSSSNISDGSIGGVGVNRRTDGSKADPSAPGRRTNVATPLHAGDLLRQEGNPSAQIMKGQQEISDALRSRSNADTANGIGGTNDIKGISPKMDFIDGGVMASAGEQNEYADKYAGSGKPMGMIRQSEMTANAVRAAATSAERFQTDAGISMPLASYKGPEAAAAMNGVTAFGNPHLSGFTYAEGEDGASYISGQMFDDGSKVTYDSVEGGIATGVYTDAEGHSTAFQMVHSNAVESQEAMEGTDSFDASKSVGMIGDGSGKTGFYVMPMASSTSDSTTIPFGQTQTYEQMMATTDMSNPAAVNAARSNLEQFINISNPVNKEVPTIEGDRLSQMKKNAYGSTPSAGGRRKGKKR